jgi:anti-sigma factor RsiW
MNTGPITEADLQAYVDRRLSPEEEAAIGAWLAEHPEEAARCAAYRAQTDLLRDALRPVLDEPLPATLDLALRGGRQVRWFAAPRAAIAAGVAALLLIGGAGGWTLRSLNLPQTVGTAALAHEAMTSYAVYATDTKRPVELAASERGALDDWISARLSRPIKAPDLRGAGLELIGGRLVATEHGPAGLYLYRYADGARVAVYVRPMEVDRNARMTRREQGQVRGWTWSDDGLGFGVFGGRASETLHGAADAVRSQFDRT